MNAERIEALLAGHPTPFYVFDRDRVREAAAELRKALGGRADLCYAMKANPFLTEAFAEVTDRIEVCSYGEFEICRSLGISPEKILISGVLKRPQDLEKILETYGDRAFYTAESPEQYRLLCAWSETHGRPLNVYLRLSSQNQFGMDAETILELVQENQRRRLLTVCGIHYFSGTQKKSMSRIQKELLHLLDFASYLKEEADFTAAELEYGAGLPAVYFEGQEDKTEENLQRFREILSELPYEGKITIELGRALAAGCGCYVTKVCDCKVTEGRSYAIVDGGLHQLNYDGQIRGMYVPKHQIYPERTAGEKKEWTVCGSLCTSNDVLIQKMPAVDLQTGDVILFENTGAYAALEGMALFLSHELPEIVLMGEAEGEQTLRTRRETYPWNMKEEF